MQTFSLLCCPMYSMLHVFIAVEKRLMKRAHSEENSHETSFVPYMLQ